MGQHWVEQASASGELHGFRLFQNDPDSADDAFIQIRSYHMKDFHKADADRYVARLKLDLKEAFALIFPKKSFKLAHPLLADAKRPESEQDGRLRQISGYEGDGGARSSERERRESPEEAARRAALEAAAEQVGYV